MNIRARCGIDDIGPQLDSGTANRQADCRTLRDRRSNRMVLSSLRRRARRTLNANPSKRWIARFGLTHLHDVT